jgi:hypothetical protein
MHELENNGNVLAVSRSGQIWINGVQRCSPFERNREARQNVMVCISGYIAVSN